ncbi:MAG TPA: 16S rRNA (guanine(527)-N(7))-methyltransferase RsmG, partial [Erythrobacter sp.]|nr:16S rRNA (guanine(527)-N(7))-methyltransferase RsmG [Erythrobacter sp.]
MITDEDQAKHYVSDLCDAAAMDKLETLTAELARENERQNLVARATLETVWQRHIADSAQLLEWGGEGSSWLDLG